MGKKEMVQQKDVVNRMLDFMKTNIVMDYHDQSPISKFYRGRSIFITGASGFVGKTLLEKLLRSCPELDKVYILLRPKRGKEIDERLKDLTESEIFGRLKGMKKGSKCLEKIVPIRGDITQPMMGIADDDLAMMAGRVSLVFHSAATVRFQEPLKLAINNNVISVKNLLDVAAELHHLKALVHVSTIYANCNREEVKEIFYESPIEATRLIEMAEWMDADTLERISPGLIKDRPNTYTYTKAVAEALLVKQVNKRFPNLPVAVVRPSIVAGIWREPIKGWVDNYNGPTGVLLSMVTGIMQAMHAYPEFCADIVPVDIVSNLLITTAWYLVTSGPNHIPSSLVPAMSHPDAPYEISNGIERNQQLVTEEIGVKKQEPATTITQNKTIEIFNCVSGSRNPVTWREFATHTLSTAAQYPCMNMIRYPGRQLIANYYVYWIFNFINHKCVAYLIDLYLAMSGKKAKMMPIYNKMENMVVTLVPFTTTQWNFDCKNVMKLYDMMDPIDQNLFNFDIEQLNWKTYLRNYYFGAKTFVMKDDPRMLPKAIMNHTKLRYINNATTFFLLMVFYYFCMHGSALERGFFDTIIYLAENVSIQI